MSEIKTSSKTTSRVTGIRLVIDGGIRLLEVHTELIPEGNPTATAIKKKTKHYPIIKKDDIFRANTEGCKTVCDINVADFMFKPETSTKIHSHITRISLKKDNGTFSLEVCSEFVEKQITEFVPADKNTEKYNTRMYVETKQLRRWTTIDTYPLHQVTIPELIEHRLSKIPGIVYKNDNRFFYAAIPGTLSLNGKFERHACGGNCTMVCKGCPRTRDLTVAYQLGSGKTFTAAVKNSWRIEKYDFIQEGIEAFNMNSTNDAFIVIQCENYCTRFDPEKTFKNAKVPLTVGLAQFVWDDFNGTTLKEVRARIRKNELKNFGQSSIDEF